MSWEWYFLILFCAFLFFVIIVLLIVVICQWRQASFQKSPHESSNPLISPDLLSEVVSLRRTNSDPSSQRVPVQVFRLSDNGNIRTSAPLRRFKLAGTRISAMVERYNDWPQTNVSSTDSDLTEFGDPAEFVLLHTFDFERLTKHFAVEESSV